MWSNRYTYTGVVIDQTFSIKTREENGYGNYIQSYFQQLLKYGSHEFIITYKLYNKGQ